MRILLLLLLSYSLFAQKSSPKVIEIYPTTDSIPVNILRFYIEFSVPMQEMDILKHIVLTNEENKNVSGVFFENQYELWNENRTQVTLIIDPGRVKLGLLANNKMGRAFDEGKKYTLTIDSLLLDFNDQRLSKKFTKTFVAVKEDRLPPETKLWTLSEPKANTKEVFSIDFNDIIDPVSAQTYIKIFKGRKAIKGTIALARHEQKWLFKPNKKWEKGNYQILVNPKLEDIAANSLNQTFDHKPSDFKPDNIKTGTLNFTIK